MTTDKLLARATALIVLLLTVTLGFTVGPEALAEPAMQAQADSGIAMKAITMGSTVMAGLAILGTIVPAVVVVLIVWFWFRHKSKSDEMKLDALKLMIEKGVPIPEQFALKEAPPAPSTSMRRSLILIALGIGLVVSFLLAGVPEAVGFGAIPFLIGVAYLLIWYLERNKTESTERAA